MYSFIDLVLINANEKTIQWNVIKIPIKFVIKFFLKTINFKKDNLIWIKINYIKTKNIKVKFAPCHTPKIIHVKKEVI